MHELHFLVQLQREFWHPSIIANGNVNTPVVKSRLHRLLRRMQGCSSLSALLSSSAVYGVEKRKTSSRKRIKFQVCFYVNKMLHHSLSRYFLHDMQHTFFLVSCAWESTVQPKSALNGKKEHTRKTRPITIQYANFTMTSSMYNLNVENAINKSKT